MKFVTLDLIDKVIKAIASKVALKSHMHEVKDVNGAVSQNSKPVFGGVFIGPSDLDTGQCNYIYPDSTNNNRLVIQYRKSDGTLEHRSIESLVDASNGDHTHDDRYLKVSGGDVTGDLTAGNKKVKLVGGDKGGHIVLITPNGQKWAIDPSNNTELKILTYGSATNGNKIVSFTFKEDGTLETTTLKANAIEGMALAGLATRLTKLEGRVTALEAK